MAAARAALDSRRATLVLTLAPHYNACRPHRSLELAVPERSTAEASANGTVRRRDRLGGLIHEYHREAA